MPTEFTRSQELISELERDLTENASLELLLKTLEELEANIPKFHKRIELGLYNAGMVAKIDALVHRTAVVREAILRRMTTSKRMRENEEETASSLAKPADIIEDEPPAKVAAIAAVSQAFEASSAAEVVISETASKAAAPQEESSLEPLFVEEIPIETTAFLARKISYAITKDFVDRIVSYLNFPTSVELTRKQAIDILLAIQLARLNGADKQSAGWQKWAALEAEASFILMDRDNSNTIAYEEFCEFACRHPSLFGPLYFISRLFEACELII
jgi:hypothetical protein